MSAPNATLTTNPTKVEVIEKPIVIQERIHHIEKQEIQPVIYREREQLEVKQVTQNLHETQVQATQVHQTTLPAQVRAPLVEKSGPITENIVQPTLQVDATLKTTQVHAPIVNETIKKTIIQEVQPVLERDVVTSTLIKETQPVFEKVVEAPHLSKETTTARDLGTKGGSLEALAAQGFPAVHIAPK